jgi:hypothetical protein
VLLIEDNEMKIKYLQIDRQIYDIKLDIDDNGFSLFWKPLIDEEATYPEQPNLSVTYEEIQSRRDFADHTVYNLYDFRHYAEPQKPALFNLFEATSAFKETGSQHAKRTGMNSAVSLIIPFASAPVSEWVFGIHVKSSNNFTVTGSSATQFPTDPVTGGLRELRDAVLPKITFAQSTVTATAGQTLTLPFSISAEGQIYTGESETYFETTGGYLPLTRIKSSGTNREVKVVVPDIPAGSTFKVKAGFKSFSGAAECIVTVS